MKVTKSALREVLAVEIRAIVREELQRELKAMFKTEPRKKPGVAKQSQKKYSVMESLEGASESPESFLQTTVRPLPTKEKLDITNPTDFNALLESTEVPPSYYQNSQVAGAGATPSSQPGQVNVNYRATQVQNAEEVDGEDLNDLENTNFGAFL